MNDGRDHHQAAEEALRAIGILSEPGSIIEIRALEVGRSLARPGQIWSGYFNFENREAIVAAIRAVDGRAEGVYVTLNRINPDLLARSNNRLQARPKHTTTDADIIEWRWLYIDADAVRPAGISATDAEHAAALDRVQKIRAFLTDRGWPEPVHGDSGNGAHLLYLLPHLELKGAGELVKRCLRALSARFSDTVVKVDEATANAARICKLYGTKACKGDPLPDRPHRRSALIETPERLEAVEVHALELLAAEAIEGLRAKTTKPPSAAARFDIEQWLAESGLQFAKGPEPYDGGRRWTLRSCPFNPAHEKPVIIELPGGALVYRCLHKSCADNDWKALRRRIEPDYRDWVVQPRRNDAKGPVEAADDLRLITDLSEIPSVWQLEQTMTWAVEDMIASGSVNLICAESGTGKTWVGYFIAGCISHGSPVLRRAVRKSEVLYLDGENPLYVVKQRLFDLGIRETSNLKAWGGWLPVPPPGPDHPLVVEFAREKKGVIIYDSLIEFHTGSEQSSTETRAFMKKFRKLANFGATVIILHHTGKAETAKLYRGSSDIKAGVDTAYILRREDEDQSQRIGKLGMKCFKGRLTPGQNFGMEFKPGEGFVPSGYVEPVRTVTEIITEVLAAHPNINQSEVVRLGRLEGCTKRQIEDCLKSGDWVESRGSKNSILYSLPGNEKVSDA